MLLTLSPLCTDLKLSQNALSGSLPPYLESISQLKHLDLSEQASFGRGLSGTILPFSNQTQLTGKDESPLKSHSLLQQSSGHFILFPGPLRH